MNRKDDDLFKMAAGQPGRFTAAPEPKADKPKGFEAGGEPRPAPRPEAIGRRMVPHGKVTG